MEYLDSNERQIQSSLNLWYQTPGFNEYNVVNLQAKDKIEGLQKISSILIDFSQTDFYQRLHSEFKLFNRVYIQSRFQVRSFPYMRTLKKLRQVLKKFFILSINTHCESIASIKLMSTSVISKQSFECLQWLFLASYELLKEIIKHSFDLVEHMTQEMTTNVFLHFPVVFVSLCSSFTEIGDEYKKLVFDTFCKLRTIDYKNLISFPQGTDFAPPRLPWDSSLEVNLDNLKLSNKKLLNITPKPQITKIDFKITAKPNIQLRGRASNVAKKPKSSFDSLGF